MCPRHVMGAFTPVFTVYTLGAKCEQGHSISIPCVKTVVAQI